MNTSPDGRYLALTEHPSPFLARGWVKWLSQYVPGAWLPKTPDGQAACVTIFDIHRQRRVAELPDQDFLGYSPQGDKFITASNGRLNVWSMPPPRPWLLILGAALLIGLSAGLFAAVGGVVLRRRA